MYLIQNNFLNLFSRFKLPKNNYRFYKPFKPFKSMTFQEKTFREMLKDCISYVRKNESLWITNRVINQTVVDAMIIQLQNDSTGHTTNKNLMIGTLVKRVYKLGRKLSFYAKDNNNQVLLNYVDIKESWFQSESDASIVITSKLLVQRGREFVSQAAEYGVSNEELDSLEIQIRSIENLPTNINLLTSDRKTATQNIKVIISDARVILDKLDDAFEGMIENETFLNGWFDVRKIKGRHHAKKATDNITAAAVKEPIA
jgi:hypothetical protein